MKTLRNKTLLGLMVTLITLVIALSLISVSAVNAAPTSPFKGLWRAVDLDGSNMQLSIAGGGQGIYQLTWRDDYWSVCDGRPGIGKGVGSLDEGNPNILHTDWIITCNSQHQSYEYQFDAFYDEGTDTMEFQYGVLWSRQAARSCFPPPAGLTGWWPGDGNTDDIVGGRDAVRHDNATFGAGLVDQAFKLDGEGDFISVPHDTALNLGTGDFTIDLWVYFNDTEEEQVLIEKWVQGSSDPEHPPGSIGWTLTKLNNNVLRLAMSSGDGPETNVDSGVLSIPKNTWTQFAATRKGTAITLFMNGVSVAAGTAPLNLDSDSSLKFGHRGEPDDRGFYLNGRIDEVELFVGRALPRGLIRAIFNAGSAGKCKE